ncbi:unnamed protein product [Phytomonas sp. EM1]|nr:unnamed protein product [Phytomonas sp. EM1]|eukprot:CCW63144.1 unnamed protein product [Phytomonas sp. isolate EM1]
MSESSGPLDPPLQVQAAPFDRSQVEHHSRDMNQQTPSPEWEMDEFEHKLQQYPSGMFSTPRQVSTQVEGTQPTHCEFNESLASAGGCHLSDSWGLLLSESESLKCTFHKTTVTVGRDRSCDIVLDDLRVSQLHFSVSVEAEVDISASSHEKNAIGEVITPSIPEISVPSFVRREKKLRSSSEISAAITGDQCAHGGGSTDFLPAPGVSVESHGCNNENNSLRVHVWNGGPNSSANIFNKVETENDVTQLVCKMNNTAATKVRFRVFLTDHSTNGTFVNDIRVGKGRRIELQTGFDIAIVRLHEKRNRNTEEDSEDWHEEEAGMAHLERPSYREHDGGVGDEGAPGKPLNSARESRNPSAPQFWDVISTSSYLEHFFFHPYPTPKMSLVEPPLSLRGVSPVLEKDLAGIPRSAREAGETRHGEGIGSRPSTHATRPTEEPSWRGTEGDEGPVGNFFMPATTPSDLPRLFNQTHPVSSPTSSVMQRAVVDAASRSANLMEGTTLPLDDSTECGTPSYVVMPSRKIQWGNRIGSGANSNVYMGIDVLSGMTLAIKVLKQSSTTPHGTPAYPSRISSTSSSYTDLTCGDFQADGMAKDFKHVEPGDGHGNGGGEEDEHKELVANCSSSDSKKSPSEAQRSGEMTKEAQQEEFVALTSISTSLDGATGTMSPATTRKEERMFERQESQKVRLRNEEKKFGSDENRSPVVATKLSATHARSTSQMMPTSSEKEVKDQKELCDAEVPEPLSVNPSADPTRCRSKDHQLLDREEEHHSLGYLLGMKRSHIRELCALSALRHQRIVQCLGFQYDPKRGFCIIMEYVAGGMLKSLIKCFGAFEENVIRLYTVQILEGLEYLASCNVVHGDLKSANILISERGNVKLADFGTSHITRKCVAKERAHSHGKIFPDAQIPCDCIPSNEVTMLCGTPLYMSPELIRTQVLTHASDIWALGCVVFEMATGGILPWREVHHCDPIAVIFHIGAQYNCAPSLIDIYNARAFMNPHHEHKNRKSHKQTRPNVVTQKPISFSIIADPCSSEESVSREHEVPDVSSAIKTPSPTFIDFMKAMFTMNPAQRPTAAELLRHPFISGDHDLAALDLWRQSVKGAVAPIQNDSPSDRGGNNLLDTHSVAHLSQTECPLPCLPSPPTSQELRSTPQEAMGSNPPHIAPEVKKSRAIGADLPPTAAPGPKDEEDTTKREVASCVGTIIGVSAASEPSPSPMGTPHVVAASIMGSPRSPSIASGNGKKKGAPIHRLTHSPAAIPQTRLSTPIHPLSSGFMTTPHKSWTLSPHPLPSRSLETAKKHELRTHLQSDSYQSGQDAEGVAHSSGVPNRLHRAHVVLPDGTAIYANYSSRPLPNDAFRNSSGSIGNSINDDKKGGGSQSYPSYSPVLRSHVNYIRNQAHRRHLRLQRQALKLHELSGDLNHTTTKPHQNDSYAPREDSTIWLPPSYDHTMHRKGKQEHNHAHGVNATNLAFTPRELRNKHHLNPNTLGCLEGVHTDGGPIHHPSHIYSPHSNVQTNRLNLLSGSPTTVAHSPTLALQIKPQGQPTTTRVNFQAGLLHPLASRHRTPRGGRPSQPPPARTASTFPVVIPPTSARQAMGLGGV